MSNLNDILKTAIDNKASDMHIIVGQPPLIRLHTQVTADGLSRRDGGRRDGAC